MKRVIFSLVLIGVIVLSNDALAPEKDVLSASHVDVKYWLVLYRRSNIEKLYKGIPGDKKNSTLIKTFRVKTGIPGERPTPLPQLAGREYWMITKKHRDDNPETAPYFLTLDVPWSDEEPFGPVPYEECYSFAGALEGKQCNWVLPGEFGLHGVNGDISRLSDENPGSSGCIRHSDDDITYLYQLLEPEKDELRYYIIDEGLSQYFYMSEV
jgi:hypothetical protein